jgi:hypothetical protein
MDDFLSRIGWGGATRRVLAADASFRRYERVDLNGRIAVLMDAPPPWEDVRPFLHVTEQLAACGASVPTVIAADEEQGFLLLEDLGDASFTRLLKEDPSREPELYRAAIEALVEIVKLSDTGEITLPSYDMAVYLREVGLFAEWFLPQLVGIEKARLLRGEWLEGWRTILASAGLQQNCLVHRDYHADNLFWLHARDGHRAVGMLDYQDALWGDAAYDVASLLEDARRDVSPDTVLACLEHFVRQTGESREDFARRYYVLAAQRNAKIIGIFVRLCVRDGKQNYLHYLPRVWQHFMRDLEHPLLEPVKMFVETHVPKPARGAFTVDPSIGGIVP